jgi:dihydroflavonol-4-reductase
MKVLVTGANGLLGSHIVQELVNRNYHVRVLVRPGSNLFLLEGLPVEYFEGQITLRHDVEKAVNGCTFVIHAAARATHKPTWLDAYQKINIDSTRYIINACKTSGIKRLIYVSTANCFVNGTRDNPGTEKGTFPRWMKRSGYAYSKFLAQQLLLDEVKKGELGAVVVNPTFIIGKDAKPGGGKIFNFILSKRIAFYPLGGKNFVDAAAAATGTVNALEKGRSGECYLLAGENLSYRQFFKIVMDYTGRNPLIIPVPCFLLKLAGRIGDVIEGVFKKPVPLTYVNARMLCRDNYYTPAKAVKELDLPLVPARETIVKTLRWFEEHNKK